MSTLRKAAFIAGGLGAYLLARKAGNPRAALFIPLSLLLVGCAGDGGNELPSKPGEPAPPAPPPPAPNIPSASIVKSPRPLPRKFDVVFGPLVSADVENATLRAMEAWERATLGFIKFTAHNRTESLKCTDSLIFIDEDTSFKGAEDGVAKHDFNVCHTISVVNPWPNRANWDLAFQRLKVSPLVAVMSHEIGHALGLPHTSTTSRSVMMPLIQLATEAFPTCMDVSLLSVLYDTPIECFEARKE